MKIHSFVNGSFCFDDRWCIENELEPRTVTSSFIDVLWCFYVVLVLTYFFMFFADIYEFLWISMNFYDWFPLFPLFIRLHLLHPLTTRRATCLVLTPLLRQRPNSIWKLWSIITYSFGLFNKWRYKSLWKTLPLLSVVPIDLHLLRSKIDESQCMEFEMKLLFFRIMKCCYHHIMEPRPTEQYWIRVKCGRRVVYFILLFIFISML